MLSSHQTVHWELTLAPGATLRAVLLSGYGESTVAGAGDALVTSIGGFYAFKQGSAEFKHLESEVMRCTGRAHRNLPERVRRQIVRDRRRLSDAAYSSLRGRRHGPLVLRSVAPSTCDHSGRPFMDNLSPHSDPSPASSAAPGFAQFTATDAFQLSQQTGEWNFEVSQLTKGPLHVESTMLALDGVSLLYITLNQTVLQRGYGPPNMVAVFIPREGFAPVFAFGQLVEARSMHDGHGRRTRRRHAWRVPGNSISHST